LGNSSLALQVASLTECDGTADAVEVVWIDDLDVLVLEVSRVDDGVVEAAVELGKSVMLPSIDVAVASLPLSASVTFGLPGEGVGIIAVRGSCSQTGTEMPIASYDALAL
jgi:hypothetical protein